MFMMQTQSGEWVVIPMLGRGHVPDHACHLKITGVGLACNLREWPLSPDLFTTVTNPIMSGELGDVTRSQMNLPPPCRPPPELVFGSGSFTQYESKKPLFSNILMNQFAEEPGSCWWFPMITGQVIRETLVAAVARMRTAREILVALSGPSPSGLESTARLEKPAFVTDEAMAAELSLHRSWSVVLLGSVVYGVLNRWGFTKSIEVITKTICTEPIERPLQQVCPSYVSCGLKRASVSDNSVQNMFGPEPVRGEYSEIAYAIHTRTSVPVYLRQSWDRAFVQQVTQVSQCLRTPILSSYPSLLSHPGFESTDMPEKMTGVDDRILQLYRATSGATCSILVLPGEIPVKEDLVVGLMEVLAAPSLDPRQRGRLFYALATSDQWKRVLQRMKPSFVPKPRVLKIDGQTLRNLFTGSTPTQALRFGNIIERYGLKVTTDDQVDRDFVRGKLVHYRLSKSIRYTPRQAEIEKWITWLKEDGGTE